MSTKQKKKFGDRKDAVWLKDIDSFHKLFPYIMPKRCDSEVYFTGSFDVTRLLELINEEKAKSDGNNRITFFHAALTAIAKTVYARPCLNRFVINKRFYQRNDITLSFVAKKKFADHAEESLMVLKIDDDDDLESISRRTVKDVAKTREDDGNKMGSMIDTCAKFPRWSLKLFFQLIKFVENHGLMPEIFTKGDSDYSTVIVSNLGSIKCGACYHHLNEYGTNSVVITIGEYYKKPVLQEDGTWISRDYCDFGITLDERIADGYYFARSVELLKYYMEHPETLAMPISEMADITKD